MLLAVVVSFAGARSPSACTPRPGSRTPATTRSPGRSLPMYIVTATVFATWFGSETVLGIPATLRQGGLGRRHRRPVRLVAVPDPGRPLLRAAAVPHEPAHHRRLLPAALQPHGRDAATLCIVISYLGWVAAQITALGLVFNVVSGGAIIAAGRHDHRRLDRAGLHDVGRHVLGGDHRLHPDDHHRASACSTSAGRWPARRRRRPWSRMRRRPASSTSAPALHSAKDILVHRRVDHDDAGLDPAAGRVPARQSAQERRTPAARSSLWAACLYFCFAFIPMFLAYSATLIDPKMVRR